MSDSRFPGQPVEGDGSDLTGPISRLLVGLRMLPKDEDSERNAIYAAFAGDPDSVHVIQSGTTAISKLWAAGLGAAVLVLWAAVKKWWPEQGDDLRIAVVSAAAFATAALVLGVAYIVGSDVRGRAAATVALMQARSAVATRFLAATAELDGHAATVPTTGATSPSSWTIVPLTPGLPVHWTKQPAANEPGWVAVAARFKDAETDYWIAKGGSHAWAPAAEVQLES